jgi:hypothetical protein
MLTWEAILHYSDLQLDNYNKEFLYDDDNLKFNKHTANIRMTPAHLRPI